MTETGENVEPAWRTVARNVRRLRLEAGWTQTQAATRLRNISNGEINWSKASWSAMERSTRKDKYDPKHRSFTADELQALAVLFLTPIDEFFVPCGFTKCPRCDGLGRVRLDEDGRQVG